MNKYLYSDIMSVFAHSAVSGSQNESDGSHAKDYLKGFGFAIMAIFIVFFACAICFAIVYVNKKNKEDDGDLITAICCCSFATLYLASAITMLVFGFKK